MQVQHNPHVGHAIVGLTPRNNGPSSASTPLPPAGKGGAPSADAALSNILSELPSDLSRPESCLSTVSRFSAHPSAHQEGGAVSEDDEDLLEMTNVLMERKISQLLENGLSGVEWLRKDTMEDLETPALEKEPAASGARTGVSKTGVAAMAINKFRHLICKDESFP